MAARRVVTPLACACLLLVLALGLLMTSSAAAAGRAARNVPLLVFPNGGSFKFVVGVTTPVKLPNRTMVWQLQFQWLYSELTNISQAEQDLQVTVGRASVYDAIAALMDSLGEDGQACVLRAICEAAETPLLHSGLLGELAHLLLTPGDQEAGLRRHREAREVGSSGGGCTRRYAACRPGRGLLDAVSALVSE